MRLSAVTNLRPFLTFRQSEQLLSSGTVKMSKLPNGEEIRQKCLVSRRYTQILKCRLNVRRRLRQTSPPLTKPNNNIKHPWMYLVVLPAVQILGPFKLKDTYSAKCKCKLCFFFPLCIYNAELQMLTRLLVKRYTRVLAGHTCSSVLCDMFCVFWHV